MARLKVVSMSIALIAVGLGLWLKYSINSARLPEHFGGYVEPGFEAVEHAFRKNFDKGFDPDGAAIAVCHNGKMVVDIWGGYADKDALRKWKEDTMTVAFSSTKATAALCIALLVDRGHLSYDDLVVKYWPEFGAHGKDNVTVKMLLAHRAGVAALDEDVTFENIRDWRLMSKMLENQKPNFPPGTQTFYHAFTFGFLCDQLLRRVDPKKRSLGQFFREEIAVPYGIDFHIGLPRDQFYRVTRMTKATILDWIIRLDNWAYAQYLFKAFYGLWSAKPDPIAERTIMNPPWLQLYSSQYFQFNDPDVLELEVPAANGVGTARALAKLLCLLIDPKTPLLSKRLLDTISEPSKDVESKFAISLSWGLAYSLGPEGKYQIGHPGYGGQSIKVDPHANVAFAYLRNNMDHDVADFSRSFQSLQSAIYESINKTQRRGKTEE